MPYSVSNNTPSAGFIQWTDVHIVYDGVDYTITAGNSSSKYIYWQLSNPTVLSGSNTYPTLGANDTIVFYNKGGTALSVLQSQVADGGLVVPGTIVSDSLATGAVTADKVQAGSITASKLVLADLTNMIPGADLSDPAAWTFSPTVSIVSVTPDISDLGYSKAIKFSSVGVPNTSPDQVAIPLSNRPADSGDRRLFEVEEGGYYRLAAKALVTAGYNGQLYCTLRFHPKEYTNTGATYTENSLVIFDGRITPAATQQTFDVAKMSGAVPVGRGYLEIIFDSHWGSDVATKTEAGEAYIANPRVYRAAAADLIVDGTITAAKIQTATITADKMLITGNGPTLNRDPQGQDVTAWAGNPVVLSGLTGLPSNGTALANTTGSSKQIFTADFIPIDVNKNYRLEMWADQTEGTGGVGYLGLACYDSSKGNLQANLQAEAIRTSWLGAGSYFYFGKSGTAFPSTWERFSVSFGPGETAKIPSDTKFVRPLALLNYNNTAGVQHAVTGIRLMEKSDADLIVDGSILASKIQAGAVTTSKLAVGDFNVLARNWNFEDGDFSWTRGSGWSIETNANAKSGTKVAIKTNNTEAVLKNQQIVPTEQGETFYAEGFIKHTAGASGTTTVRIMGLNSAGAESVIAFGTAVQNAVTTYTKCSMSATVPANIVSVYVDVQSTMTTGTAYVDEVRLFRTSNTTLIADGAITTNKILSNQINADKIQSGQISTDKLTVLASEYVNPVSITGNIRGWAGVSELGVGTSNYASYDTVEKALKIIPTETDLSVAISSNSWAINHSKIYRVSMQVKKSTANGHYRIGVSAHSSFVGSAEAANTALSGLTITGYGPNRTSSISLASFDVASETTAAPTTYVTHVFYLIGANRSINDCPNHVSPANLEADYPYVQLPAEATYAQLRLLNWDNVSGKLSNLLVRGISVTEVGAGQIVASNITAGAIVAGKIASKAISTDSLIVTGAGAALNADPCGEDINSWENIEGSVPIPLTGQSDSPVGTTAIANTTATRSRVATREYIPIDALKNYRLEIWAKRIAATTGTNGGNGSIGILWYTSATSTARITTVPTGWTNSPSTYSTFGISNTTFPDNWTRYRIEFGPNEKAAIAPGAKFVRIMAFLNDSTTGGTQHAITNVRLMEKAQADLIVDGSIVAAKIDTGAVTASKLAVGDFSVLTRNWNFEEGDTTTWQKEDGWSIISDSTNAKSGSWVARWSGTTSKALRNTQLVSTEQGETFYGEAYIKRTAGDGNAYVRLRYINSSGAEIDSIAGNTITSGTYTKSAVSVTIPANVVTVNIEVVGQNGTFYADEVRMFRTSNATLIADGVITTQKISTVGLDAGVIKAGTIDANRIGANTISTGKLLVTGIGAALNEDPGCQDDSAWTYGAHGVTALRRTISDSVSGNSVFSSYDLGPCSVDTSKSYPVSSDKKYRLSAWARRVGDANGTFYFRLVDQANTQINLGVEGVALGTSWAKYSVEYTPTTSQKLVRIRAILNLTGSKSTTNYSEITDIRLEEKTVGDLIVDGTIVGAKIAANTIEASKLLISNPTGSLLPDPTFEDQNSWSNTYGGTKALFKAVTDAKAGRYVMYITAGQKERNATWYPGAGTSTIPIDINKKYRLTFYYRTIGTSGATSYATLQQRNSTGDFATGNSGHGFYLWSVGAVNVPNWTKVEVLAGAGTNKTFNSTTKYVAPSFLLNWENVGDEIQISDVRFEEVVTSTLIEDGAITTDKVGANQITGGKIYAGTIEADRISGNSLQTNSIDASKIQAGAVLAEKLAVVTFGDSALLNSGFEEPQALDATLPAKWTRNNVWGGNSSTTYRDPYVYRSGSACLTLFPGAGKSADAKAESIPLVPGDKWYLSFWAYATNFTLPDSSSSVSRFYARLRGGASNTSTDVQVVSTIDDIIVPTSWRKYEVTFIIPEGMRWGAPIFLNYQNNTGSAVHIDDVTFRKVVSSTLIENGAVTTEKMVADTINGDRIAGNTLSGGKIIAGSITADRLFIPAFGAALNQDPNMADSTAWTLYDTGENQVTAQFATITDGKVGNTVARNPVKGAGYAGTWMNAAKRTPIDPTKTYRVRAWIRRVAGSGTRAAYIGVALFDANGSNIGTTGAGSTQWYYAATVIPTTTWTEYTGSFGADTAAGRTFPANARTMAPLFILGWKDDSNEQHEIQDLRIEEVLPGTLIKDGTITTAKIETGGLDAKVITTGLLTTDVLEVGSITSAKLYNGATQALRIQANNISSDAIDARTLSISNDSESDANGIFMDGTNKKILIKNAGVVRVKIGFLG